MENGVWEQATGYHDDMFNVWRDGSFGYWTDFLELDESFAIERDFLACCENTDAYAYFVSQICLNGKRINMKVYMCNKLLNFAFIVLYAVTF